MTAIKDSDILSLGYYKHGQPFSGSYRGMRYRIEKQAEKDEKGKDIGPVTLRAAVWPEPFSYVNTEDDQKEIKEFPFSEEGKAEVTAWLNERYESRAWPGQHDTVRNTERSIE